MLGFGIKENTDIYPILALKIRKGISSRAKPLPNPPLFKGRCD
jgi:hypothetical protein